LSKSKGQDSARSTPTVQMGDNRTASDPTLSHHLLKMRDTILTSLIGKPAITLSGLCKRFHVLPTDRVVLCKLLVESPLLVVADSSILHAWDRHLTALHIHTTDVVDLVSWAEERTIPDPLKFASHVCTYPQLYQVSRLPNRRVRRTTLLNAHDKETLVRGLTRVGMKGVCRCELLAEYSTAYISLYELERASQVVCHNGRVWILPEP
jgi:hypothetical protein